MENGFGQQEQEIILNEKTGYEEKSSESIHETIQLTDKDVFTKIWTSPRMVFRFIVDNEYENYMYVILFLAGVMSALDRASSRNMGDQIPLVFLLFGSIIVGGTFGWLTFYIYSALLSWTGTLLKGAADTRTLFRMFTYSIIPSVLTLLLIVIQIILFGNGIFRSDFNFLEMSFPVILFFAIVFFIESVLCIWSIILLVIGISEVQHFSIGKSIVSLLIPSFLIMIPIMIIVILLS